jgi:hypothetical protein
MEAQSFSPGLLPERSVLRIDGPEAAHFLHNLLTADIEGLKAGGATYAALLTPQGKMLFDVFVIRDGEGFPVDCASSQKAELIKRLGFYRLRAKVTITDLTDREVGVSPEKPAAGPAFADPRDGAMGWRVIAARGSLPSGSGYHGLRIRLGLADTDADLGSGEFFPHEANLDQLGAVSFNKELLCGRKWSRAWSTGDGRSRILPCGSIVGAGQGKRDRFRRQGGGHTAVVRGQRCAGPHPARPAGRGEGAAADGRCRNSGNETALGAL